MHGQNPQPELLLPARLVGNPYHFGAGMQPFSAGWTESIRTSI